MCSSATFTFVMFPHQTVVSIFVGSKDIVFTIVLHEGEQKHNLSHIGVSFHSVFMPSSLHIIKQSPLPCLSVRHKLKNY